MVMDDDIPQTVHQAVSMGWTALSARCPSGHEGRIMMEDLIRLRGGQWRLASVFDRAACSICGQRPKSGKLAWSMMIGDIVSWHEREVFFMDGFVVKPGRW